MLLETPDVARKDLSSKEADSQGGLITLLYWREMAASELSAAKLIRFAGADCNAVEASGSVVTNTAALSSIARGSNVVVSAQTLARVAEQSTGTEWIESLNACRR